MGMPASHVLLGTYKPPAHQRDVDALQAKVRAELASGQRTLFKPPPPTPGRSANQLDQRIAEELELVARQLEQLGGWFAADPLLLSRHSTQLQSIDLMKQVLGHLGRLVAAADRDLALEQISLKELQARLGRKPLRSIVERD